MFGWFRNDCPIDLESKVWVEQRMCWLAETVGFDRMRAVTVVTPTAQWFPDHYRGSDEDIQQFYRSICGWMGIPEDRCQLEIYDEEDGPLGLYYYQKGEAAPERIGILRSQASDPSSLAATIAHELSHAVLLGDGHITTLAADHEFVTDLLTVFLGMGIFTVNSRLHEEHQRMGHFYGESMSLRGYLDELSLSYALALFAWARGDLRPAWRSYLRPNARDVFQRSMKFLTKTGDSTFGPDGFIPVGSLTQPRPLQDSECDLRSNSAGRRLAALLELQRHVSLPDRLAEVFADLLADDWPAIRSNAAELLSTMNGAASPFVAKLIDMTFDSDEANRALALRTLSSLRIDADRVLPAARCLLPDPSEDVRELAFSTIGAYGRQAAEEVEHLIPLMKAGRECVAVGAIEALGEIGPSAATAIDHLVPIVRDNQWPQCVSAARALGGIGQPTPVVMTVLRGALASDITELQLAAITALPQLDSSCAETARYLLDAVQTGEPHVAMAATTALARHGMHVDVVVRSCAPWVLTAPVLSDDDEDFIDDDMYDAVVEVLEGIGLPGVGPTIELLDGDPTQRRFALWLLGRIGPTANSARQAVRAQLIDSDPVIRFLAGVALWNTGSPANEAVPAIVEVLGQCDLSEPGLSALGVCPLVESCRGFAAFFLEERESIDSTLRSAVRVALREIGAPAAQSMVDIGQTAPGVLRDELQFVLAAINRDTIKQANERGIVETLASRVSCDLETRRWLREAIGFGDEWANRARGHELSVMSLPMTNKCPDDGTPSDPPSPIREAVDLLVATLS